jgi:hypothetical protein
MPKARWAVSQDEPEEIESYEVYDGDKPPGGVVYAGRLTRLSVKANKNDDPMINGLVLVDEPKGAAKSKYNGYPIWFNQNVTEQGAPYVNQFLAALGLTWTEFRTKTVTEGDIPEHKGEPATRIMKIGSVKFNDGNEPRLRVLTKDDAYNGAPKLSVVQFLKPRGEQADPAEEDSEEDEDSEEVAAGGKAPF